LQAAGNTFFDVITLPHANHNMSQAETGSLREQQEQKPWKIAPGFVETVEDWLVSQLEYWGTTN
jgi:hypothetical protein